MEQVQIQEILNEVRVLADRTDRIETHIEYQREQNDRIERALHTMNEVKAKVETHDMKLKGFAWILGLFVSAISAKVFGKL